MSKNIVFVSQTRPIIKPIELFIILLFVCFAAAPNVSAADFVVTTNADNGAGSLREALAVAGANSQPDTITFNSLFNTAQIITLNGELVIAADGGNALTITGTGTNLLAISGNNQSRVLFINSGANVNIAGVTIRNGRVSGIDGVTGGGMNGVGTNATGELGGGIFNQGALNLISVVVSNNTAMGGTGGGGANGANGSSTVVGQVGRGGGIGGDGKGGGIYNVGTITLTNSTISNNSARGGKGGDGGNGGNGINAPGGGVGGQGGRGHGGGIYNIGGTVTLENSTVSTNLANGGAGGRGGNGGQGLGNPPNGNGGSGNSGGGGGGDSNASFAGFGGAEGGGIHNRGGTINLTNVTISNNTAEAGAGGNGGNGGNGNNSGGNGGGGGSGGWSFGGGILNANSSTAGGSIPSIANVTNSTISNNIAPRPIQGMGGQAGNPGGNPGGLGGLGDGLGGGIFIGVFGGMLNIGNVIVGDNQAGNTVISTYDIHTGGQSNSVVSRGFNLIENMPPFGVNPNSNNIYGQDPQLAPLGNYGGATQTVALLSGSPAINAGSNTVAGTPAADQRGANRQGNPDIGAFEVNNPYIAAAPAARANQEYNLILAPDSQNFTFALAPGSNALPPGLSLTTSFAPEAVVAITGTPTLAGTYNFTVRATDAGGNFVDTNYQIIVAAAPTAASVTVGGRVTTADGNGIRHARVSMTDSNGNSRTVLTGKFGAYGFRDVAAGETYVISVAAKRFTFRQPSQIRTISEDVSDIDFAANEE